MMYNVPNTIHGKKIYSGPFLKEEPKKVHIKSKAMSENYHKRVQEKWNKRYGMKQVPCFFMVGDSILAHPSVITELEKESSNKKYT